MTAQNNFSNGRIAFNDLFDLGDIQKLQDLFSEANGVASIITDIKGKPITKPSNFCRLCSTIIRKTKTGETNCFKSDALIGRHNPSGPVVQPCLSGGLWDAGASITVGGVHVANWLIGQVKNEELDTKKMLLYADEIGADREAFMEALNEVPEMSVEKFNMISKMLFEFAKQLSDKAYLNLQLKDQLDNNAKLNDEIHLKNNILEKRILALEKRDNKSVQYILDNLPGFAFIKDIDLNYLSANQTFCDLLKISYDEIKGKTDYDIFPKDLAEKYIKDDKKVIESGKPLLVEEVTVDANKPGHRFVVATRKLPWFDEHGEIAGIYGLGFDISDLKHIEQIKEAKEKAIQSEQEIQEKYEELMITEEELRVSNEELVKVNDELQEALYSLGDSLKELQHVNKKLEESETRFKSIINKSPFPVAVASLVDDTIFYWSQSAKNLFGHIPNRIEDWFKLAYPNEDHRKNVIERWGPLFELARKSQRPVNTGAYEITCANGKVIVCEIYATFLSDSFIVTFNDITERLKAEEQLKNQNKNLEELMNFGQSLIKTPEVRPLLQTIIDGVTNLFELDTGAIYLINNNEIILEATTPPLPIDFPDLFRRDIILNHPHINQTISSGKPVSIYDTNRAKLSPEEKDVCEKRGLKSIIYMPLGDLNNIIGLLVLGTTKNNRELTENEMDLLHTISSQTFFPIKNAQLYEKINEANQKLELRVHERTLKLNSANQELQSFVYSISHDLRAPLRSIMGFTQIISRRYRDSFNEEGLEYFGYIQEASENMANLIEDLLRFSRLTQGVVIKEPINLNEVIDQACANLHQDIQSRNAKITVPKKAITIQGDRSLLNQVILNLLQNAITYHTEGISPEVNVTVEEKGKYHILKIKDNGLGIPKEHQEKIFNIFQRLHSNEEYPGTGIGLAIVKKAVNALNGKISVESEPGVGSTFIIHLLKK